MPGAVARLVFSLHGTRRRILVNETVISMTFRKRPELDAKGFSLVELMVVVAVIGIVAAAGMPTFIGYIRTSTLKGGAQEVTSLLGRGRQLAIKGNESVCIKVDATNPNYGTRVRFLRGTCGATQTCTATGDVTPCFWTGAGTDGNGYVTLANRIEVRPPATDVVFTYIGGASTTGSFSVRVIDNPSGTSTVAVVSSGKVAYTFP
jgi:prepilin-type N-terminal cleavage/methylation domain-containing protein